MRCVRGFALVLTHLGPDLVVAFACEICTKKSQGEEKAKQEWQLRQEQEEIRELVERQASERAKKRENEEREASRKEQAEEEGREREKRKKEKDEEDKAIVKEIQEMDPPVAPPPFTFWVGLSVLLGR